VSLARRGPRGLRIAQMDAHGAGWAHPARCGATCHDPLHTRRRGAARGRSTGRCSSSLCLRLSAVALGNGGPVDPEDARDRTDAEPSVKGIPDKLVTLVDLTLHAVLLAGERGVERATFRCEMSRCASHYRFRSRTLLLAVLSVNLNACAQALA